MESTQAKKTVLGLKMPTDQRWAAIAQRNLQELLTDHAYCEQKAASNAISLIVKYPEYPDMVAEMTRIAREEMEHFGQVHQKLLDRGFTLGRERKDPYVNDLATLVDRSGSKEQAMVDRLLFAATVEARSCERFRMLSETVEDEDLRNFYYDLMVSEADHYKVFLGFAKQHGKGVDVDQRWSTFLDHEARVIQRYGKDSTMHG